jgi:hypothetical protein
MISMLRNRKFKASKRHLYGQLHLSTAILLMIAAGGLMWFEFHHAPAEVVQSEWQRVDGMAMRIAVSDPNIRVDTPNVVRIEYRNESATAKAMRKQGSYVGGEYPRDSVMFFDTGGNAIHSQSVLYLGGFVRPFTLQDFDILKPNDVMIHHIDISVQPTLYSEYIVIHAAQVEAEASGGPVYIRVLHYDSLKYTELRKKIEDSGAELWSGPVTSAALPLWVNVPWTWTRGLKRAAYGLVLLSGIGSVAEWLARARSRKRIL